MHYEKDENQRRPAEHWMQTIERFLKIDGHVFLKIDRTCHHQRRYCYHNSYTKNGVDKSVPLAHIVCWRANAKPC